MSLAQMSLGRRSAPARRCAPKEVVLAVADGRSVRTLINATPIRAEGDEIGSVGRPLLTPAITWSDRRFA